MYVAILSPTHRSRCGKRQMSKIGHAYFMQTSTGLTPSRLLVQPGGNSEMSGNRTLYAAVLVLAG